MRPQSGHRARHAYHERRPRLYKSCSTSCWIAQERWIICDLDLLTLLRLSWCDRLALFKTSWCPRGGYWLYKNTGYSMLSVWLRSMSFSCAKNQEHRWRLVIWWLSLGPLGGLIDCTRTLVVAGFQCCFVLCFFCVRKAENTGDNLWSGGSIWALLVPAWGLLIAQEHWW